MVLERKLLERSKKGDEIAIGFQKSATKGNLALEHIRKLVEGKMPGLKVKCAFDIDGRGNTWYNYVTGKTKPCKDIHRGGSGMALVNTGDDARPSELLKPVYDFCDCLDKPPRIWYFQDGLVPRGGYEIAEARLTYKPTAWMCSHGLDGTYHADSMKMLRVIEKLTLPPVEGGNGEIRGMVERDAYFIYKTFGMEYPELNWHSAQAGLVSKIIANMRRDNAFIRISGHLETDGWVSELLDDVNKNIVYINLFSELKGDDSIHLTPYTRVPLKSYIDYIMGQERHVSGSISCFI